MIINLYDDNDHVQQQYDQEKKLISEEWRRLLFQIEFLKRYIFFSLRTWTTYFYRPALSAYCVQGTVSGVPAIQSI